MSNVNLYVQLLAHTIQSEEVVAMGARLCYSGANIEDLRSSVGQKDQGAFIKKLADMGHQSPIEHASFTFGIEGVSRALLAQITRHRLASFSVQSQRYVEQAKNGMNYIVPPSIEALGAKAADVYRAQMTQIELWYEQWVALLGNDKKEDARFVLPNSCETRMMVTMNARELSHVIAIRACNRAQWEIRAAAWAMLGHVLRVAPSLFDKTAPDCVHGHCGEGGMSCGRQDEVKTNYANLLRFVEQHKDDEDFATIISKWATKNIAYK